MAVLDKGLPLPLPAPPPRQDPPQPPARAGVAGCRRAPGSTPRSAVAAQEELPVNQSNVQQHRSRRQAAAWVGASGSHLLLGSIPQIATTAQTPTRMRAPRRLSQAMELAWAGASGCRWLPSIYTRMPWVLHFGHDWSPSTPASIKCADYCKWVPRGSWQTTPDCRSCSGNVSSPLPLGPTAPVNGSNASCSNWCQWVPTASWNLTHGCHGCFGQELHGPFLPHSGSDVGNCVGWCQWVPQNSWQYTPECGGCSGRRPVGPDSGRPVNGTQGVCVNWCRWVPHASWQHTPSCHGCSGGSPAVRPDSPITPGQGCATWCQYVPSASQQYTPQCRGCAQGGSGSATVPAPAPATPGGCASWCGWVPTPSRTSTHRSAVDVLRVQAAQHQLRSLLDAPLGVSMSQCPHGSTLPAARAAR